MGYLVTFDDASGIIRVNQTGVDCDAVDAMNAMDCVRADPRFASMGRLLVDLRDGVASRTMLEAEVLAGMLESAFRGKQLAYVVPDSLRPQLDFAAALVNGADGTVRMAIFQTVEAAQDWLERD